jgi:hypothetical protein
LRRRRQGVWLVAEKGGGLRRGPIFIMPLRYRGDKQPAF